MSHKYSAGDRLRLNPVAIQKVIDNARTDSISTLNLPLIVLEGLIDIARTTQVVVLKENHFTSRNDYDIERVDKESFEHWTNSIWVYEDWLTTSISVNEEIE